MGIFLWWPDARFTAFLSVGIATERFVRYVQTNFDLHPVLEIQTNAKNAFPRLRSRRGISECPSEVDLTALSRYDAV